MFFPIVSVLVILTTATIDIKMRQKRSVAPFLGAGGSRPTGMLISPELWHCGSDGGTRNISYRTAAKDCPSLGAALNHCCAVHDDCYGQQNGQDKCDREFCECNRMVTRLPTSEGYKCRAFTEDACFIIKFLGVFAYGDSNYNDPNKPSANVLTVPTSTPNIENDYMLLYSHCPYVNITLASCATNFDLCALVHSEDFCANDLCHCMLDAAESDVVHNLRCSRSVAHLCRLALQHSSDVLSSRNFTRNLIIIALLFIFASSIGFSMFYMYSRVNASNITFDSRKFMHIHTVSSSRSVNPLLFNIE